ncbi:MAG: HAD-IA family hydrolase [Pacificimonas sp.]|nr:HAD-IA family hydrolase [Pacificimonas sp.]
MTKPPKPAICFDLDGTLVDTAPDLAGAMNAVLAHFGRPRVETDAVRDMVGYGARRTIEKGLALTGGGSAAMVDEGLPLFLEHYAANICDQSRPWDGVEAVLDALADEAVLSICTNKPEALACALVDALGWRERFAAIVGGDTLTMKKPDPQHLTETIRRSGGDPERAVFVGDSSADSRAADAAGVPFVLLTCGYADIPLSEMVAAERVPSFDRLPDALRRAAPAIW